MSRSIFEDRKREFKKRRKILSIVGLSVFTGVSIYVFFALNFYLMPSIKAFFVELIEYISSKKLFEFIFDEGRIPAGLFLIMIECIFLYGILHCSKKLFRLKWPKKRSINLDLDLEWLNHFYHERHCKKLLLENELAKKYNSKCPKCGKGKVVDKISLTTGFLKSSFWGSFAEIDTKEVNGCRACGHQWRKSTVDVESSDVLVEMFREMHNFFSGVELKNFKDPLRRVRAESVRYFLDNDFSFVNHRIINDLRWLPVKELKKYCTGK